MFADFLLGLPFVLGQIPTPDPSQLTTAVTNSGVTVNAMFGWAEPLLTVGAGFVLLGIALRFAPRITGAIRSMGR